MKKFFSFTSDPVSDTFATMLGVTSNYSDHKLFLWQNNVWFTIDDVSIRPQEKIVQISINISFACVQDKDYPLNNNSLMADGLSRLLIGLGRGFGSEILFQQVRFTYNTGGIMTPSAENPILLIGSR